MTYYQELCDAASHPEKVEVSASTTTGDCQPAGRFLKGISGTKRALSCIPMDLATHSALA